MYEYSLEDAARRCVEPGKKSQMLHHNDERGPFARDRARVLHSAALRRLADKTQVVGPRDGDTPRTRLTHSLEVAQIARGIGAGLGLNPDLCEMAGLTHDIGHPPYGHNGETALNEIATECGGFEGNAQTLRILTKLEPKILSPQGESFGLNLTRASLDAACKYPRTKTNPDGSVNRKYGCYDEDREILDWIRYGHSDQTPPVEAQAMDFSDDIAYSVHDVEDGIVSGRVNLSVLWDFVELAELAEKGARAFGGDPAALIDAADRLRDLPVVAAAADFSGTLRGFTTLKSMTSELVGRYIGAVIEASRSGNTEKHPLGRGTGRIVIPADAMAEVTLLKTIAVLYVMDAPAHLSRQDRQRERIYRVFEYLTAGGCGALDPMFRTWWEQANTPAEQQRVIIDQIASMTESRLERMAKQSADLAGFFG
ncbi:deoxyguanosinetriphosphate triphosphohydrolase [Corynebacterium ulcerans]|nr:deoxyguanosinetriphosphate triphosphohydrolase [Corynebacterium ulcerans]AEG84322.1 dGTP triphosphohydrolase [Corynebacterium ulcerans BR-AD22]KPH74817.1 deoxyguanosinetriphosphate triphosphohydrolase [Corynebacterium ulcerans]MBH5297938.1 deoxyguanosinetriphosphate triphosphohydrolase [Corynebacterium ulcerans]MBL4943322.1 deoxyguanosinetriphosphate triphosphohydrolase [Corynebacterium ulcerans]NOL57241.1 deoxyguanosinetriphosphate triphosphohydrolase [Corynebacterium ulcerans]